MIELRWLKMPGCNEVLQYRTKVSKYNADLGNHYVWSAWIDVPTVVQQGDQDEGDKTGA